MDALNASCSAIIRQSRSASSDESRSRMKSACTRSRPRAREQSAATTEPADAARHPDDGSAAAQLLLHLFADRLLDARGGRCGV